MLAPHSICQENKWAVKGKSKVSSPMSKVRNTLLTLDIGLETLDLSLWTLDFGLWTYLLLPADFFFQTLNLGGVIMCVGGVNLEPDFRAVEPALGMPAFALPVFVRHPVQQLHSRRA